jgi:hypothetical protein
VRNEQIKRLFLIASALAVWWLGTAIFVWLAKDNERLVPGGMPFILGAAAALLIVCFRFRENELVFLIWFPLAVISAVLCLGMLNAILAELPYTGGPNAAPLEGVAMFFGLGILAAALVTLGLCVASYPKRHSIPIVLLAVANTAAVASTVWLHNETESRQLVTIMILDRTLKPLSGVEVHYAVYGYGPGGTRPYRPSVRGGPIFSGPDGRVILRSKRMRHELDAAFEKSGYQPININLGMQYDKYNPVRSLRIGLGSMGSKTHPIAWANVPAAEPMEFVVYLPTDDQSQSLQHYDLQTTINREGYSRRYLDLETREFTGDPRSDLRFDFFEEKDTQGYRRGRLRITGLNGTMITQVPFYVTLTEPPSSFDTVMQWAPEQGYEESIIIREPGSSPGPSVYVRWKDGTRYARLTLTGYCNLHLDEPKEGFVRAKLIVNPSGSRNLLLPTKQ